MSCSLFLVVRVEFVAAFAASVEDGRAFISTSQLLGMVEHLLSMTLRALFVRNRLNLQLFGIDILHIVVLGPQRRGKGAWLRG